MLVGYARVSTLDQNPQLQIGALRDAGCEKIYSEKASTRSQRRPALEKALAYLRAGDTLVVWKLDRLARSLSQLIQTIDELRAADIGFHSLTEQLDTTTPAGRALFQISGAFAEFERSIIQERTRAGLEAARAAGQERTRAGLEAARAAGKTLGRPAKLDPAKLKAARAMLRDPALTIREIAEQLDVSRSTLYRHFPAARSPPPMTAPPNYGLASIATYLSQLAARSDLRPDAKTLRKHANHLDRADRELRHLSALPGSRVVLAAEDIAFHGQIDEHWQFDQAEIDAEIASGA